MHEKTNIDELLAKYLQQTISDAEQSELSEWVCASEKNAAVFNQLTNSNWVIDELKEICSIDENRGWEQIAAYRYQKNDIGNDERKPLVSKLWFRVAVAASIITAISTTVYLMQLGLETNKQTGAQAIAHTPNDVKAPEKNRAVITLSNGKMVYLDSMSDGTMLTQAGVNLIKQKDGQLTYQADSAAQTVAYNTLFNPRGSKPVKLTLSDGSHVWLNSETTLRYPINFIGIERRVEITGEAYFEVSKIPLRPFIVISGKIEVEVLGTHFNINAYPDEGMVETTLLEGKVKLHSGGHSAELMPNQQAIFSENVQNRFTIDKNVDIDKVMAWKQEMFQFDDSELQVIMRQIGRWYNKDIVYEKKPGAEKFGGNIGRNVLLSDVLKMLEENGINFTITEKAIIIKP